MLHVQDNSQAKLMQILLTSEMILEVASPYESFEAAHQLLALLDEYNRNHDYGK